MTDDRADAERIGAARDRQRELYGAPVGERVRRITAGLDITQGRLARTLGLSPAMLSQLVSGRRVKIGDPAVLARLMALDAAVPAGPGTPPPAEEVEALLGRVRAARPGWTPGPDLLSVRSPDDAAAAVPQQVPASAGRDATVHRLRPARGPVAAFDPRPGAAGPADVSGAAAPAAPVAPVPGAAAAEPAGARHAAAAALRAVSGPARLVAAAAVLDGAFPEVADVLRCAAVHGR
ncbi:helix-turn-helix domain-containing protein [Pseudonocardia dioxanivorans]|uniref:helix-turn-helix domain-containing protein n=1 Tax=Pseudonocardia dioxanivorans TaxID=240495 RepID=UPI000CD1313F|nr:helix-turn-helix transcriptional regulator [Pseudonocardia dioxanivorans]